MAHRYYGSTDDRTGSIQNSEQKRQEEKKRLRKRLSQNVTYCLLILFILFAFFISTSLLTFSAFPVFQTKSNQVELGDTSEGLNSSGVITIDDDVSTVELTLIQPLHDDGGLKVNILTSSTRPPLSFTTLKENIKIDVPLKGQFRAGCNILLYDEPIYLQHNSSLKYNITSSNDEVIKLCYFNNTSDYITFLTDYTFEYDSRFCFSIADGNATIEITINEASSYYFAIDTGGNTSISVDITIVRSYYNIKTLLELSSNKTHCSLAESFNFSCIIKICDGYLCDPTKNRYVIVETSHHVMLKYDTHITFHFKPTVRVILFSCSMFLELIAVAAALTMVYKLCKKSGPQTEPKCTCKGVLIAVMAVLFVMSLHLIAITFATINTDWLVNSNSTRRVGNKYPVLLNSQGFNKSVSNVEITLSFPSADLVSVYKVLCSSLKTSSTKLGPNRILPMTIVKNSRTGFNFNNYSIPLNLAPGSIVTYNIDVSSTLSFTSSTCISLVFMNSLEAYDEFLNIQASFTSYVFRSDCLENGNTNVSFTVKNEQNEYYVGIETTNIDINVSAEVSVVQVYYDLSNTKVHTKLSVNETSCNVRVCKTFYCVDHHDTCILVNSTSFDLISYSSHSAIATIRSTSTIFGFLAIITCSAFCLILFISFDRFGYYIKKNDVVSRKILSRSILISIFMGIMIFEGVFIPIILHYSVKFSGNAWVNNTKDFVLVHLHHKGLIKWIDTHDISFSVETDSYSSVSLYTVDCSEVVPITSVNRSKIECHNFSSSCVLNEFIYLVNTEENYVNYSISLSSTISGLSFRVSTFDKYEEYENFLAKRLYTPIHQSNLFTDNETFNFSFSNIYMTQKAAYYHFVLHPAFQTDVFQFSQYYSTNSSVQMESSTSYYNLSDNYRPQCNITNNSTSICHSSIKDHTCIVVRANMLTKPIHLDVKTKISPLGVFTAIVVVPAALVVFIFVIGLVFLAFRFRWKSSKENVQSERYLSEKDGELAGEGESTRQEEQPGNELAREGQLARDSQQSGELATDDKSTRKDDQTDKLEDDVHIAGRKLFKIQNNLSHVLNWEEYGLRIKVPEGAISSSETTEVAITALVGGEFILPEDSELVSAVYTISVSKPLLKPVLLEIQHCVSIETQSHANYLSFVASSNNHCPFEFQTDKGSFPVGERYGNILIYKFSSLCIIIEKIKGWFDNLRYSNRSITPQTIESDSSLMEDALPVLWYYFAQPLYEIQRLGREWDLVFLFGKDLNAIKMHMKNEFKRSKSDKDFSFKFESPDGCIEIHTDTENCSEGWSIRPHQKNPTKVSRSTIDKYECMDPPCFPQCRFTITATPGINTNPELKHPVTFTGITSDNEVFNIVLSMDQQSLKEIFKRKYYDALSNQMTPPDMEAIADDIYASGLITYETLEACRANSTTDMGHTLLDALTVIIDQPGVLTALIDVLKKFPAFKSIAREMERELISVT